MASREFDPLRLDVAAFAKDEGRLDGQWTLREFVRLNDEAHAEALPGDRDGVVWHARGEWRRVGGESQPWLHLKATSRMALVCQRCLGPVEQPLEVARSFLFVHGEDAAAQLDADSEDDVLALTKALDLHELIEDELLLALPLVPLHDLCPEPLPLAVEPDDPGEKLNPFAALAALKRGPPN